MCKAQGFWFSEGWSGYPSLNSWRGAVILVGTWRKGVPARGNSQGTARGRLQGRRIWIVKGTGRGRTVGNGTQLYRVKGSWIFFFLRQFSPAIILSCNVYDIPCLQTSLRYSFLGWLMKILFSRPEVGLGNCKTNEPPWIFDAGGTHFKELFFIVLSLTGWGKTPPLTPPPTHWVLNLGPCEC